MIKVTRNKSFINMRNKLEEIYAIYNTSNIDDLLRRIYKSKIYYKQVTPLIQNYNGLISDEYFTIFKASISFIGKCYKFVTEDNNAIYIKPWNDNEILYDISEFGTLPKVKNNLENNGTKMNPYKTVISNAFAKNNFLYMCIKAEIMIYIFYIIISKYHNININDEIKVLIGGINYALTKSENLMSNCTTRNNKINYMASYVWELSSLFNLFIHYASLLQTQVNIKCLLPERNVYYNGTQLINDDVHIYDDIDDMYIGLTTDVINNDITKYCQCIINPTNERNGINITVNYPITTLTIKDDDICAYIENNTIRYKNIIDDINVLLRTTDNILISKLTLVLSSI